MEAYATSHNAPPRAHAGALSSGTVGHTIPEYVLGRFARMATAPTSEPTVIIIDDDLAIREAVSDLIQSVGFRTIVMASVDEFRRSSRPSGPSCLVLDVRLPGQSGLDLQRELAASRIELPIVFMTGHGDIPMSVQAMKGGAIEFLTKPFRDQGSPGRGPAWHLPRPRPPRQREVDGGVARAL